MPIKVESYRCTVCGHEFEGTNAKALATICEEHGEPDPKIKLGTKIIIGIYAYIVREAYAVYGGRTSNTNPAPKPHRVHYRLDGYARYDAKKKMWKKSMMGRKAPETMVLESKKWLAEWDEYIVD